jgi:(p)ppGpp synthase/HD superfamily hydrolase
MIHPLEAASMVERSGYPDHVVAAAVLHDVLEDTDTQRRELRERFGPEVAELVEVLSDDPAITYQDARRDDVRERVRRAGGDALSRTHSISSGLSPYGIGSPYRAPVWLRRWL